MSKMFTMILIDQSRLQNFRKQLITRMNEALDKSLDLKEMVHKSEEMLKLKQDDVQEIEHRTEKLEDHIRREKMVNY